MIIRIMAIVAALLLPTFAARAETIHPSPQVGDAYEISRVSESSQQSGDGSSSGSSHDRDTIVERVIGVRQDGLELEYDLPAEATAQDRAADWHFPVRVFRPLLGQPTLLNRPELAARLERWLVAAGMTRAACGHWIFTWNAFRIECEPDDVVQILEQFDLTRDDLREGALYRDPMAREPAPMTRREAGLDGAIFTVEMTVDPEAVRRGHVESDLVVAEITRQSLTPEAARAARANEDISGTIIVTFYPDAGGNVLRRTRVVRTEIRGTDGQVESRTITETLERRPLPRLNR